MKSDQETSAAIEKYADTVRRVCFIHLKNKNDVEDIFQEVFLKYVLSEHPFQSETHEKAWIIRVTVNACRDQLRSFFRRRAVSLEASGLDPAFLQDGEQEIWDAVFSLPEKYRSVIYLHYYEGYTAVEMAKILQKNENTIYSWLLRAKERLRTQLGGDSIASYDL